MIPTFIHRVSWSTVGEYLDQIANSIDPHDFSGVYGIPRGGSVLAAWLSHKLYLPLLSEIKPNCIIIDDICDSGTTMSEVLKGLDPTVVSHCWVTVMYCTPGCLTDEIDYFFREKGDNWLAFPWEQ